MVIWGIDTGTEKSGVVLWGPVTGKIALASIDDNAALEKVLLRQAGLNFEDHIAIERITAQGRQWVGNETMQAIEWQARFERAAQQAGLTVRMIPRHEVRAHLGNDDSAIRATLIARWGGEAKAIGTKAAPGPLYGVKSHCWQALAVAVTYYDKLELEKRLEA